FIHDNFANGVSVAAGTGNLITQNSIRANGLLGIDLGINGVSPNDHLDPDAGPNLTQNFPVLKAVSEGNGARIDISLDSIPGATFVVEIFVNSAANAFGFGEGETYLLSRTITADADGNVHDFFRTKTLKLGDIITATATDAAHNTSE